MDSKELEIDFQKILEEKDTFELNLEDSVDLGLEDDGPTEVTEQPTFLKPQDEKDPSQEKNENSFSLSGGDFTLGISMEDLAKTQEEIRKNYETENKKALEQNKEIEIQSPQNDLKNLNDIHIPEDLSLSLENPTSLSQDFPLESKNINQYQEIPQNNTKEEISLHNISIEIASHKSTENQKASLSKENTKIQNLKKTAEREIIDEQEEKRILKELEKKDKTEFTVQTRNKKNSDIDQIKAKNSFIEKLKSKENQKNVRHAILGLGGSLILGALFFFQDPLMEILTSSSLEVEMAAQPLSPQPLPQGNQVAQVAQVAQVPQEKAIQPQTISSQKTQAVAFPNQSLFNNIEEKIVLGSLLETIKAFRQKLLSPLNEEEKKYSDSLRARYYLLKGTPQEALNILNPLCQNIIPQDFEICIHHTRSLISLQNWKEAQLSYKKIVDIVNQNESLKMTSSSLLEIMDACISFGISPSMPNFNRIMNHFYTDTNLNAEWFRQRSIWIAKALMTSSLSLQQQMIQKISKEDQEKLLSSIELQKKSGLAKYDRFLHDLINMLNKTYNFKTISFKVSYFNIAESQLDITADIYRISYNYGTLSSDALLAATLPVVKHPILHEAGTLLKLNILISESLWSDALFIISNRKNEKSSFAYEWTKTMALYYINQKNTSYLKTLLSHLAKFDHLPFIKDDFYHWLLKSEIQRILQIDNSHSVSQMKDFSQNQDQKILTTIEEAEGIITKGKEKEGLQLLLQQYKTHPQHYLLLQSLIQNVGRIGLNPKEYINKAAEINIKSESSFQKYPLFSRYTHASLTSKL